MNKSDLEKILLEEIETVINEEELDEQSFLKRVASAFRGKRRGDQLRAKRAKARSRGTYNVDDSGQAPADTKTPEPAAKEDSGKTISLTKDIFPDLIPDIPSQDRHKLTKLVKRLKRDRIIGKKISNSERERLKDEYSKIDVYSSKLRDAIKNAGSKRSQLASQMSKTVSVDDVKNKIQNAASIVDIDPQIVKYILNDIEDNTTLVENIVLAIIKENLNGNKVVL